MRAIKDFADKGGHVLGVCNGFQMLTEAGLLPGALLRNATLRFLSMDCHMRVERADTPYTSRFQRGQVFRSTMAHGDGNYFADEATLDALEGEGLVALRYATPAGEVTEAANRNGSARGIAGILSPNLRVLGLMPHPGEPGGPADRRHRRAAAVREPGGDRWRRPEDQARSGREEVSPPPNPSPSFFQSGAPTPRID